MFEVTFVLISKQTGKNISVICDSYEEYGDFYKLNFGKNLALFFWSQNFNRSLIKNIKKCYL